MTCEDKMKELESRSDASATPRHIHPSPHTRSHNHKIRTHTHTNYHDTIRTASYQYASSPTVNCRLNDLSGEY